MSTGTDEAIGMEVEQIVCDFAYCDHVGCRCDEAKEVLRKIKDYCETELEK